MLKKVLEQCGGHLTISSSDLSLTIAYWECAQSQRGLSPNISLKAPQPVRAKRTVTLRETDFCGE